MFDKKEKEIAQNSKDPEELHQLAMNNGDGVKRIVALNPYTSEKTLKSLAFSLDQKTRVAVVYHPQTPIDVLEKLSGLKLHLRGYDLELTKFVDFIPSGPVAMSDVEELQIAHYALVNLLKRTGKL